MTRATAATAISGGNSLTTTEPVMWQAATMSYEMSKGMSASASAKKGLKKGAESPTPTPTTTSKGGQADTKVTSPVVVNINLKQENKNEGGGGGGSSDIPSVGGSLSGSFSKNDTEATSSFARNSATAKAAEKVSKKNLKFTEFTLGGNPNADWRAWAATVASR
ncbi:hypothetical protein THAOC_05216, partial [Thalassiosira oceanica]